MYTGHYEGSNPNFEKDGERQIVQRCISHSNIVFDVGANQGEWAKLVLKYHPDIELHCFEISMPTYQKLSSQNFPKNVRLNNFGVSSRNGEATLFVFAEGADTNSLYKRSGLEHWGVKPQEKEEVVSLRALDDYCLEKNIRNVDFLKIDVEGHELEVLQGSSLMLRQGRIAIIQFEYSGAYIDARILLKDVFELFKGLPYQFYKIVPMGVLPVHAYTQELENFQYSNYLAIHEGHGAQKALKIW